jgi:hypothetical protein
MKRAGVNFYPLLIQDVDLHAFRLSMDFPPAPSGYNLQLEINVNCHSPISKVFIGELARIAGRSDQSPVLFQSFLLYAVNAPAGSVDLQLRVT